MLTDAFQLEDPDKRSRLLGHASSSEKATRVKAMIELATAEEGVPVTPQDLDADPCLLNVLNGTVDLRTGTLYEHRRSDLITKIAPVVYDPRAMCPTWLAFQQRIMGGNEELIAFKQRAVGYALTGLVTEKRSLFFYYGTGNNGKTTELELLRDMLGDYAGQLRIESLMEQRSRDGNAPSPDIADLRGLRFVISSEPSEGQRLAEATIKYLTGMGTIKARHLHKENFEFKQTWKFFMDCNHKPVIRGTDRAIWNRIGLVPFDIVISDEEIDKELPAKLREELPGILAWAVEGCLAWQASGLEVPAQIRRATEGYRAEMDVIGRFVEERCVMMSSLACRGKELYKNYTQWCVESGEPPLTLTSFGLRMAEKGFRKKHDEKGVKYEGLGIAFQGTDDADQS
jgi:putative DNA primase/helicase